MTRSISDVRTPVSVELTGAGAGLPSIGGWLIAIAAMVLLLGIGWWSTTRGRRRRDRRRDTDSDRLDPRHGGVRARATHDR